MLTMTLEIDALWKMSLRILFFSKSPNPSSGFLPHILSNTYINIHRIFSDYIYIFYVRNYCYICPKMQQAASEVVHSKMMWHDNPFYISENWTSLLLRPWFMLGSRSQWMLFCSPHRKWVRAPFFWHPKYFPDSILIMDDFPGISV